MTGKNGGDTGRAGRPAGHLVAIVCGTALILMPLAAQGQTLDWPPAGLAGTQPRMPSEDTAMALCVVGTVSAAVMPFIALEGGWGTLAVMCVGPSLGFLYGGCWGRGLMTAGLRFGFTFAMALAALNDDCARWPGPLWIGGLAFSAALDILTVKKAVLKRNGRRLGRRGLLVDMAPFAVPKGAGVRLQLSF